MKKIKLTTLKGILSISLIISPFINGFSQQLTPDVIASAGDYFSKPTASLSWTIGEDMTETFTSSSNILTQGFQQPYPEWVGIPEIADDDQFVVFPNPGSGNVYISFNTHNPREIMINLYDVTGRLIKSEKTSTAVSPYNIDISAYASNCYYLSIADEKSKLLFSTIIIKP